ncbi:hypothetical protein ACFYP4_02675 [Streptomyces sp. NPDC005551]|uniref:hypothetical protein n=1 Tax=Streptomyces sp. NPDC005551 TaxID=3364725 RepID=UPI00367ECEC3
MTANYPTIVRKFQQHVDGTEFVMAGHMNDAQDEITAIQSTLGPRPHVYTPVSGNPTTYTSVATRLDTVQRKQASQQGQIDDLISASDEGWALPIASVHATGTTIPATKTTSDVLPSDWYNMRWNRASLDTNGAYSAGPYLTIPKTGWWILTARVMMHTPSIPNTVEHALYGRMRILSSTSAHQTVNWDLAAADSSSQGTTHAWHRLTLAAAWDFYVGDRVSIQLRHDFFPTNSGQGTPAKSSLTAATRLQLTYVRGLPDYAARDYYQLDDEIGT